MNREELAIVLAQFDVRPNSYELFSQGNEDEVYAIANENDGWKVFYCERGTRTAERTFLSEAEACDDLPFRIATDKLTRST
jgi:hypothetical protein